MPTVPEDPDNPQLRRQNLIRQEDPVGVRLVGLKGRYHLIAEPPLNGGKPTG